MSVGALYITYVAAGLDPARFWKITPRMMALELEGAAIRIARERELVWLGAMLPYFKKTPSLEEFAGQKPDRAERARRFHSAWDKIDAALSRNHKKD